MNSNGKTKRLSKNGTDHASHAKKKVKKNHGGYKKQWKALGPYLRVASKSEVTNLTKTLFKELYERGGSNRGDDIVSSLVKEHNMNKNHRIADSSWVFDEGSLSIMDGLDSVSIACERCFSDGNELKLTTTNDADVLCYEGDTEFYYKDYKIYVTLNYNPGNDTIEGSAKAELLGVSPRVRFHGPMYEADFRFTAKRDDFSDESDSDSDSESDSGCDSD